MSKICFGSSCNVHSVCHNYCQHDGACVVTVDDDMWESTCDCTIGFYGETCTRNNLLDVWERRVWSDSIFTLPEAMRYSQVALDMLKDHLKHEFQLQASSVSFNNVLELVADGVDKKMKRKDDIFPFVEVYADGLTYIITILQMKGCAIGQVINCTINHIQFESILTKAEANLIRITNLWLETDDGQGIQKTVDKRDILSLTVLKDKGKNLPFEFFTKYGYMKLPYFETFQDTIGSAVVAVNVLTYIQSPYKYVNNTDATTSSTVKVVITDKKGKQLKLRDLDDPVDMAVDMTKIFASSHTWIKPEILDDGSSMVVAYVNETNEAYSVEFKLKSVLECTIYGIFGYTKPSVFNRAISIKTKGIKKILEIEPVDQPVFFNDSILQITVYNTKYSSGGYLDPLVLTLSCQDDVARRRRRDLSEYMGHFYRVQILSVVNLKGTKWDTSAGSKISRAEGNVAVFKSTFFGTFGSDALFSPPTPINFVDIFLNFSEKLQQTPQVLAAEVFLIIFFIAIVIPLRRADQKDRLLWEYLPLVDNEPDDKVQYCLAIFTSIRSSKILSSTVFFTLNGKKATTNARMVKTDSREGKTLIGNCLK
ncbi:uncharacterized protein [Magallana gigas]|uniref:uncharacterized protein n=1 Tax=Magallana gigas TaxID=29159 RepID=UPI00333E8B4E